MRNLRLKEVQEWSRLAGLGGALEGPRLRAPASWLHSGQESHGIAFLRACHHRDKTGHKETLPEFQDNLM